MGQKFHRKKLFELPAEMGGNLQGKALIERRFWKKSKAGAIKLIVFCFKVGHIKRSANLMLYKLSVVSFGGICHICIAIEMYNYL